jgi:hypothetical protein
VVDDKTESEDEDGEEVGIILSGLVSSGATLAIKGGK